MGVRRFLVCEGRDDSKDARGLQPPSGGNFSVRAVHFPASVWRAGEHLLIKFVWHSALGRRELLRMSHLFIPILAVAEIPAAAPNGMWSLSLPWWEFIVRGIIVYAFLLILIRITGKRQVGQLAPFDLVLLLVLSNAVQNAMNGGDNSVGGGLISAVTLVLLNYLIGMATYRSKAIEALIEGRPDVIIHNGTLYPSVMKRAKLTHHELNAALRQAGCSGINDVHTAVLENNGALSVVPKSRAEK